MSLCYKHYIRSSGRGRHLCTSDQVFHVPDHGSLLMCLGCVLCFGRSDSPLSLNYFCNLYFYKISVYQEHVWAVCKQLGVVIKLRTTPSLLTSMHLATKANCLFKKKGCMCVYKVRINLQEQDFLLITQCCAGQSHAAGQNDPVCWKCQLKTNCTLFPSTAFLPVVKK